MAREREDDDLLDATSRHLARLLGREKHDDTDQMRKRAERAAARFLARAGAGRPLVTAIVVEDP
jgi:hypothetical protein